MNKVTFVTNSGEGLPRTVEIRDDVLVSEFLSVNFEGDLDDYQFSIRRDGQSHTAHMDEVLMNGDRLVAAPRRVKGEK
jgi:hypothetical protein